MNLRRRGWRSWALSAALFAVAWIVWTFGLKGASWVAHLFGYMFLIDAYIAFRRMREEQR